MRCKRISGSISEEVGQQRAWDHGANFVLRHLTVEVEEIGAPMDAIFDNESTNAELFNSSSLIYIHCCDFSHTFTFTIPSLPFLKLRGIFAHFSLWLNI